MIGELVKIRRLISIGLLGAGMTLLPVATGIAGAVPAANGNGNGNGNNGNGNGNNGNGNNGNGNNGNGNGNTCTPRGKHNHYPPGQCKKTSDKSSVNPGDSVTVFSEGWASLTNVDEELHSDPLFLKTLLADANGDATGTLLIPCNAAPGNHEIVSVGVLPNGTPFTQTVSVSVNNKPCVLGEQVTNTQTGTATGTPAATPAATGTSTSGSSTLPFTGGAATTMLATLAVALIAAGSIAVVAARRRRSVV